ncbi:cupin [Streptomyces thinghirensis]|nr:cupin [Streptomyces thinghirensis]
MRSSIKTLDKLDEWQAISPGIHRGRAHGRASIPAVATFRAPGWRWSESVAPIAGTDSCQVHHTSRLSSSGRMRIRMDDGAESEVGPGDVFVCSPGHDAWVVGDEPAWPTTSRAVWLREYAKTD